MSIHIPLYTIRHGKIGGTEFAIYNLIRGLAGLGKNVDLYNGRDSDLSKVFLEWASKDNNIKIHQTGGIPGPKSVRFLEELWYQQRRSDTEWTIFPNYFCPPSFKSGQKNCVILHDIQYRCFPQYHSKKRRMWLDFYLPKMFDTADSVILISNSELELVRENFGEKAASRCDVVYNAIDFKRFEFTGESTNNLISELRNKPYILSVCHQFPHKNLATLLSAFSDLAQTDRDISLYMVGSVSKDNLSFIESNLPEFARKRVNLTGFVTDSELGQLYANAKLFVLPSLYEGFGMPAVEALGLGVPTIVSNAFSLPEVTLGIAKLIDEPLKPKAWSAAIREAILSNQSPTPEQVAKIRATYAPEATASSLISVLESRDLASRPPLR